MLYLHVTMDQIKKLAVANKGLAERQHDPEPLNTVRWFYGNKHLPWFLCSFPNGTSASACAHCVSRARQDTLQLRVFQGVRVQRYDHLAWSGTLTPVISSC